MEKEIPDYGKRIPIVEFIECCNDGLFIDYDGFGYYSDGKTMTDLIVRPSDIMEGKIQREFPFVIWFNR